MCIPCARGGQLAAGLGAGASSTHWRAWGSLVPAVVLPQHSAISSLALFAPSGHSDNLTPPPPSSKTCVGQEKLSYCTHKSNIYCLCYDNARSCYQGAVILNVLQIQNKEFSVHCHLLPVCLAHHETRIGKTRCNSLAIAFWAVF